MSVKSSKIINIICVFYVLLALSNFLFPISEILPSISRITLILLGIFILITSIWAIYRKELKNINLRVNYLHGKIEIESSENGTMITLEIPYVADHQNKNLAH